MATANELPTESKRSTIPIQFCLPLLLTYVSSLGFLAELQERKKYKYTQSNNSIGPVQLKYIVWIKLRCSLCGTVLLLPLAERPINLTNKWILVIEPIKY